MISAIEINQALRCLTLPYLNDFAVEDAMCAHIVNLRKTAVEVDESLHHDWRPAFKRRPLSSGETLIHRQVFVCKIARQFLMSPRQDIHTNSFVIDEVLIGRRAFIHANQQSRR